MYPWNTVCFRYVIVNTLHKGDNDYGDDDDDDNNNNVHLSFFGTVTCFVCVISLSYNVESINWIALLITDNRLILHVSNNGVVIRCSLQKYVYGLQKTSVVNPKISWSKISLISYRFKISVTTFTEVHHSNLSYKIWIHITFSHCIIKKFS
jgi:hypothetical protein